MKSEAKVLNGSEARKVISDVGFGKAKVLSKSEQRDLQIGDGLENLVAQLGTEQDKRSASRFVNSKRLSVDGNQVELDALYRTNSLAGKIVDIIPNDMTREWREFTGQIETDTIKELTDEEERLDLPGAFNEAHKWGRLYGTAFIIMSIDDGGAPEEPLDINKIKKGGLRHIKVIDRHRISNAEVQPIGDPLNANFGLPEFYRFNETTVKIHHSRVLRFDGVKLPYDEFRKNNYYSDSVLDRLYDVLTNLSTVSNGAASMVYETNVDIIKVKNLFQMLSSAEGELLLRKRFTVAGVLKSFNNMLLLDNEESFETKKNNFSGLPALLDRYGQHVVAGSDIPAPRLMGETATGLNTTGTGDLKNYYDMLKSRQSSEYRPKLNYFDVIMAKSLGLPDDIDLDYEFVSLFQMTPTEQAALEFNNAQRDAIYLTNDVVTEAIVAKELQQNSTYTNITDEHIEELEVLPDADFNADPNNFENIPEQEDEEGEDKEGEAG